MLARRFIIVCLLVMLFGMGFAILIAKASHGAPDRFVAAAGHDCLLGGGCAYDLSGSRRLR